MSKKVTVELLSDDLLILLNCINHSYSASQFEADYEVRAGATMEMAESLRLRLKQEDDQLEKRIMQ